MSFLFFALPFPTIDEQKVKTFFPSRTKTKRKRKSSQMYSAIVLISDFPLPIPPAPFYLRLHARTHMMECKKQSKSLHQGPREANRKHKSWYGGGGGKKTLPIHGVSIFRFNCGSVKSSLSSCVYLGRERRGKMNWKSLWHGNVEHMLKQCSIEKYFESSASHSHTAVHSSTSSL